MRSTCSRERGSSGPRFRLSASHLLWPSATAQTLVVTVASVLCITSCSSGPRSGVSPRTSASASSPSSSRATAPAADTGAVETAYRAFWPTLTSFDRRYPEAQWKTVLSRVSVDPQLSQAIAVAKEQRRNGITLYGQPQPRTPRIAIDSRAKATLADCVDFSRSGQADAKTGQRKTVGLARTPVTLTLTKGVDGWRVSNVTFPGGKC